MSPSRHPPETGDVGKASGRRLAGAAGIMMASLLLSRVLGLVREAVISGKLGQGAQSDVYMAAFLLPDTLFFLIAGGALLAQESGLTMAVENLPPGYLGHTPDEIFWLLEDVDTRTTGICFDTGHANLSGRFEDFARALLPRAICTHIHDNDGNSDQHAFPGLGTINWPVFSRIYHECGCTAGIMLECALPEGIGWGEASHRFRTLIEP